MTALPKGFFRQNRSEAAHPGEQRDVDRSDRAGGLVFFFVRARRGDANFGAFIAFMGVNAAAFVRYFLRAERKSIWPVTLGRARLWNCGYIFLAFESACEKAWDHLAGCGS